MTNDPKVTAPSVPPTPTPGLAVALSSSFFGFYCHGAFMAELHRQGIYPSHVAGASTGALTAVLCGSGLRGQALEDFIWQRGVRRSVVDGGFWWRMFGVISHSFGTGVFTGDNIAKFLRARLGNARLESMCNPFVQLAVTNLTGRTLDIVREGDAIEYAVASCCVPGLFQARRVGGNLYCDGGTVDVCPFEHWLDQPDVDTIVLHEIVHERGSQPRAPGGGTNLPLAMAICHEIISDVLLRYRLRLGSIPGKRVIHLRTVTPHPGLFPRAARYILQERGREAALRLCEQLRVGAD